MPAVLNKKRGDDSWASSTKNSRGGTPRAFLHAVKMKAGTAILFSCEICRRENKLPRNRSPTRVGVRDVVTTSDSGGIPKAPSRKIDKKFLVSWFFHSKPLMTKPSFDARWRKD